MVTDNLFLYLYHADIFTLDFGKIPDIEQQIITLFFCKNINEYYEKYSDFDITKELEKAYNFAYDSTIPDYLLETSKNAIKSKIKKLAYKSQFISTENNINRLIGLINVKYYDKIINAYKVSKNINKLRHLVVKILIELVEYLDINYLGVNAINKVVKIIRKGLKNEIN